VAKARTVKAAEKAELAEDIEDCARRIAAIESAPISGNSRVPREEVRLMAVRELRRLKRRLEDYGEEE